MEATRKIVHSRGKEDHIGDLVQVHSISNMVGVMATAATHTASVGGYATAIRENSSKSYNMPSDEWVRKAFARADADTVEVALEKVISRQLEQLTELGCIKGAITIAIDKHLIPRYDRNPGEELLRSKRKKGTGKFEAYITAQCVDAGRRLTLAVYPIGQGHSTAEFVRKIMNACDRYGIRVRGFLMDREFFSVSVLGSVNENDKKYTVPCRNTHNVVMYLNEFDRGVRDAVSEGILENTESSTKYVLVIAKRITYKGDDPDAGAEKRLIGFAVNSSEADVAAYKKRWGIETGYRMIEDIRLKTRSTNQAARMLCFAASVILYNQWVVINAVCGHVGTDCTWTGIVFTMLKFKAVIDSGYGIKPEPPPDDIQ